MWSHLPITTHQQIAISFFYAWKETGCCWILTIPCLQCRWLSMDQLLGERQHPRFAPAARPFLAGDPSLCQQKHTWAGEDRYTQRWVCLQEFILVMPRPLFAAGSHWSFPSMSPHLLIVRAGHGWGGPSRCLCRRWPLPEPRLPTTRHHAGSGRGAIAGVRSGGRLARIPPLRSWIPWQSSESSPLPSFSALRLMFKQRLSYKSPLEAFLRTNS